MIRTDEGAFDTFARGDIDNIPKDLPVPIHDAVLAGEILVFRMDVVGEGLWGRGTELAPEVFAIDPDLQLECI